MDSRLPLCNHCVYVQSLIQSCDHGEQRLCSIRLPLVFNFLNAVSALNKHQKHVRENTSCQKEEAHVSCGVAYSTNLGAFTWSRRRYAAQPPSRQEHKSSHKLWESFGGSLQVACLPPLISLVTLTFILPMCALRFSHQTIPFRCFTGPSERSSSERNESFPTNHIAHKTLVRLLSTAFCLPRWMISGTAPASFMYIQGVPRRGLLSLSVYIGFPLRNNALDVYNSAVGVRCCCQMNYDNQLCYRPSKLL